MIIFQSFTGNSFPNLRKSDVSEVGPHIETQPQAKRDVCSMLGLYPIIDKDINL